MALEYVAVQQLGARLMDMGGALFPSRLMHLSMTIRVSLSSSASQISIPTMFIASSPIWPAETLPLVLFIP